MYKHNTWKAVLCCVIRNTELERESSYDSAAKSRCCAANGRKEVALICNESVAGANTQFVMITYCVWARAGSDGA